MPTMPALDTEWTYEPPDASAPVDVDIVRFYCQDTDRKVRFLADLEIQYLVDVWMPKHDSLVYVAAVAAETIAAKFAGVTSVSADGVSVAVGDIAAHYTALAEQLRQLHKDAQVGGEVDISNLMWDQQPDWLIQPLEFGIAKDDNIYAGRQNYGSHRQGYGGVDSELIGGY